MGIYLPKTKIPTTCAICWMFEICPISQKRESAWRIERHPDCPLVEMPESSGRIAIIDFDTALLELNSLFNDCIKRKIQPNKDDFEMALNVLTIIEEER